MKPLLFLTAILFSGKLYAQSYPVAVVFHSVCCGVPADKPVMNYIISFKKKYRLKKISYDHIGPLGKEGEYEICFRLKEMTKKQSTLFISGLKKITPGMIDKGNAEIQEHVSTDRASLPGRVQVVKMSI